MSHWRRIDSASVVLVALIPLFEDRLKVAGANLSE